MAPLRSRGPKSTDPSPRGLHREKKATIVFSRARCGIVLEGKPVAGTGANWNYTAEQWAARDRKRRRDIAATPQGWAFEERREFLRETFPDLPWVEVYASGGRPDRTGGISADDIERARSELGAEQTQWLKLLREFHLVRWRTWLDSTYPPGTRRVPYPVTELRRRAKHRERQQEARQGADSGGRQGRVAGRRVRPL